MDTLAYTNTYTIVYAALSKYTHILQILNLMIVTMMTLTVTMETAYLPLTSVMEKMTVQTTAMKKIAVINE